MIIVHKETDSLSAGLILLTAFSCNHNLSSWPSYSCEGNYVLEKSVVVFVGDQQMQFEKTGNRMPVFISPVSG